MIEVQSHRGPDGQGAWSGCVGRTRIALGSVRLAVQDLTSAGDQPMVSASGRQVLVYNGEVYNYPDLRRELEGLGMRFRSSGDTEVVLCALRTWGVQAFERFNGMWGIAYLDADDGTLLLSRDRFGIKPLYWHRRDDRLLFASEIKGILVGSGHRFAVDHEVVGRFLLQSQLDAQERTFFAGIEALPAGTYARFDLTSSTSLTPVVQSYWTAPHDEILRDGTPPSFTNVRETFLDSVRLRLRSDVPVGVLLSGGVDSSAIAAGVQCWIGRRSDLHLFSIVSDDHRFSEERFINRMATHLGAGARLERVRFGVDNIFELLDRVIWFNDEPPGSLSPVAHYLLMQRAKDLGVTVILCGQGADELLCGYFKYWGFYLQSLWRSGQWGTALGGASDVARRRTLLPYFRINEAKRYLPDLLRPREIDIRGPRLQENDYHVDLGLGEAGVVQRQLADLYRLSLPALLHYEDRMSMALAREIRLPYLDYRLVEQLVPLAPRWKMRDGWSKWVFRKAMESDLPAEIAWRRDKQGFTNSQDQWLKRELRPQINALLCDDLVTSMHGLLDRRALQRRYDVYCRYPADRGPLSFKDMFNPLALELWARRFESFLDLDA